MKELQRLEQLAPKQLRQRVDEKQFAFKTTDEIKDLTEFVGQSRALKAVQLGIGIKNEGYNLYAMGPPGIGKHSVIRTILEAEAIKEPIPSDWCLINNFQEPQKPIPIELPAGFGSILRQDMELLLEDLKISIPVTFQSDEYKLEMQKISDETNDQQVKMLNTIIENARQEGLEIFSSEGGFTILPINEHGEVISSDDFKKLPEDIRHKKETLMAQFSKQIAEFMKKIPHLYNERRKKEKEIKKEFTFLAVGHFIDDLKKKYKKFPTVIDYLNAVQQDILVNFKDFIKPEEEVNTFLGIEKFLFTRYKVNVLVDHASTKGAPVIYEDHPSYQNLICRVDHVAQFGSLVTDFTLIKPGALHKANGGYLLLDALKVLQHPLTWDGLKRALNTHKLTIETPERMTGLFSTVSLDPKPIPLKIKVILLGDRYTYHLLCTLDPDFNEIFKVAVDFEENIDRNHKNEIIYAQLIATLARKYQLRSLDRKAVASIIEQTVRLAEDTEKLSTHMGSIKNLIQEADFFAGKSNRKVIQAGDVKKAIEAQIHRLDQYKQLIYEDINREIVLIETKGGRIGQINGLSVINHIGLSFGHPSRITARVRFGRYGVIDIQREVKMSGPIHSKGVLILSGFLTGRYIKDDPFSLTASLVFEQTYGMVEGDSASVAELCVLLSALANVPIKQSLAVTGSINQHGDIQAIGGVNQKIEGFFDVCKARGLTGEQGVLIPAINIKHLMLREDVVHAVKNKKFHIYAIKTIDQAIKLLTGITAGKRNKYGIFPKDSINDRVEKCLEQFAQDKIRVNKNSH